MSAAAGANRWVGWKPTIPDLPACDAQALKAVIRRAPTLRLSQQHRWQGEGQVHEGSKHPDRRPTVPCRRTHAGLCTAPNTPVSMRRGRCSHRPVSRSDQSAFEGGIAHLLTYDRYESRGYLLSRGARSSPCAAGQGTATVDGTAADLREPVVEPEQKAHQRTTRPGQPTASRCEITPAPTAGCRGNRSPTIRPNP
jgi:hypothetical protein